jgi:Pyruvate/2-oxoacid:ferredoxin oxidoreductase gamma subunit/Pyruvate/2-oxoacid:ferredoxin oxidoreductase delta subunit
MIANNRLAARIERGEPIDLRGDGKAGGGLVLAVQAFGAALAARGDLDVQDWPLFSSARKGANVRAFLRVARGTVEAACQVTNPDIALLMNEAAAAEIDFAEGTSDAIYVINCDATPEEAAARHRLGGVIATVPGDALGLRHLDRPLGNIGVLAALVRATELVDSTVARGVLEANLKKRRIPLRLIDANLALYDEALEKVTIAEVAAGPTTSHARPRFAGYGALPTGAQAALRSARRNRTAGYGRPGVKIEFNDPKGRCNGCTLCVVQCPEGIIDFTADRARGAIVHGARFDQYCKVCRECIAACPLDLFHEVDAVARPEGALPEGA